MNNVIEATIFKGKYTCEDVLIPWISLIPNTMPFAISIKKITRTVAKLYTNIDIFVMSANYIISGKFKFLKMTSSNSKENIE
ncbi:ATP-dependent DNA helicase PIF1-like [Aphis craccivora]|uniref:ATP-dependent DNA helicase PIF1-like n=1 Tax=Aphis craccivora TaxID=307492 RepID=A0A6G0VRC8_APHCR|nr:ATP-dependent DNA helicase PIF1-like [Aphis craccivora]